MNVNLYRARLLDTKLNAGYFDGQKMSHVWEKEFV